MMLVHDDVADYRDGDDDDDVFFMTRMAWLSLLPVEECNYDGLCLMHLTIRTNT